MALPRPLSVLLLLLPVAMCIPQAPPPHSHLPTTRTHTAPQFCHTLLKQPRPLPSTCRLNKATRLCADGRPTFFGQMRQDYYLYTRHFRHLPRRGVYIDVATNDPISISNTFFFDACLGWSGLCVEAHPGMVQDIQSVRSCGMVPTCVGDRDGEKVEFVLDGGLSGVRGTNKNKKRWYGGRGGVKKVCSTLGREFATWDVGVVDYLSLDVEGHELHVLKGIDWGKVRVNVMTVEVTKESLEGVQRFLEGKGFKRHWPELEGSDKSGLLHEDAVFLYKDVVWGHPK